MKAAGTIDAPRRRPASPRDLFGLLSTLAPTDTTITFDPRVIGPDPEAYLRRCEAQVPKIRKGLEKEIVWHDPTARHKTALAVVYVHGLAASKEETRPVADEVARATAANLYYARLTGHGRPSSALTEATVNRWINDVAEAMEIGRRIGDRVVVIATSTGAALAAWMALEAPAIGASLAGLVLISPNFRPPGRLMALANTTIGAALVEWRVRRQFAIVEPDPELAHAWTKPVPISAILTALAASHLIYRTDVRSAKVPTLFIYSRQDRVVSPKATDQLFEAWGGDKERFLVTGSTNPTHHVIAGRLRSPENTDLVVARIVAWLERSGLATGDPESTASP